MKKKLTYIVSGIVATVMSFSTSIAQAEGFKELPLVTITASTTSVNVNAKINKAFSQFFQSATNLRWYEVEKKLLAKFIMNDRENRALFTKNGELVYHVAYGSEAFLPEEVRHLLKSKYYDQTVTRVLKVNQDRRTIWVIRLEDAKDHIMVRVEDMELEETQRLHKTK